MVRVVGNIRDYEGTKHILVFEIFAVEDFNQLTNHLLDVILTHCKHTKGPIPVRLSDLLVCLLACFAFKIPWGSGIHSILRSLFQPIRLS